MLNWYNYGEHAPSTSDWIAVSIATKASISRSRKAAAPGVTVQALAAGSVQFGYADVGTMMKATAKGAPVKAVGVLLQKSPMSAMGFADKNIVKPSDLVGKTVAVTPGDALSQLWPVFLKVNNVQESQIKTVAGDATTKRNAVVSGQADLLLGNVTINKRSSRNRPASRCAPCCSPTSASIDQRRHHRSKDLIAKNPASSNGHDGVDEVGRGGREVTG
jgi:NitT/TauT family transport system substrate-binding protein